MTLHFQGTHFIDQAILMKPKGVRVEFFLNRDAEKLRNGYFDNVLVYDTGSGEREEDAAYQDVLQAAAEVNNIPLDSFYRFSEKTLPSITPGPASADLTKAEGMTVA